MRLSLMYHNWSQAPEIWSHRTKLTVDVNRVSSPAILWTRACVGPGKLKIQSYALFFIFPELFLFPRLLHLKQRWAKLRLLVLKELIPPRLQGWEPTSFFRSFAMATNLCVVVWVGPIKDKDHLQSWNLHLESKFPTLKGFRSDVWEWSPPCSL